MKLCKDCKWFTKSGDIGFCGAMKELKLGTPDLVYGGLIVESENCYDVRSKDGACGVEAKYFEEK